MKVYVCYWDCDSDEGCSAPEAAFLTEQEAIDWCKDDPVHYQYKDFDLGEPL